MGGKSAAIDWSFVKSDGKQSTADLFHRLRNHIQTYNRRITTETGIAVGVGVFSTAVVFGGTYALVMWLSAIRTPPTQTLRDPWTMVLAMTGGFYFLSSVWAWWRLRRIRQVELWAEEHDPVRDFMTNSPAHTWDSQLGKFWLQAVVAAPIFLVKALMIWRRRARFNQDLLLRARDILLEAFDGEPNIRSSDVPALRILRRSGLVKTSRGSDGRIRVWITGAGMDLV